MNLPIKFFKVIDLEYDLRIKLQIEFLNKLFNSRYAEQNKEVSIKKLETLNEQENKVLDKNILDSKKIVQDGSISPNDSIPKSSTELCGNIDTKEINQKRKRSLDISSVSEDSKKKQQDPFSTINNSSKQVQKAKDKSKKKSKADPFVTRHHSASLVNGTSSSSCKKPKTNSLTMPEKNSSNILTEKAKVMSKCNGAKADVSTINSNLTLDFMFRCKANSLIESKNRLSECSTCARKVIARCAHLAQEKQRVFKIVQYLLYIGVPASSHKNLPLINSVLNNAVEMVSLLLNYGADPNCNDGMAVLLACSKGHYKALNQLVESGAVVNSKALKLAAKNRHWDIVGTLMEMNIMPDSETLRYMTT
ncbi:putative ankyrin repeat protein L45 [Smittium culicis]|uniref:Putative ankyrin repeat protein L45 n=1 Tax=Smittium culicis TaxID=133412 RepID=A0A1R1XEQ7_9FUNG|nr:putative ankyrin repeat protein L45 [Smittium culicis]